MLKYRIYIYFILFSFSGFSQLSSEYKNISNEIVIAAGCSPATSITNLNFNNVNARIETSGSLWFNSATSSASYEVPKGSGNTSLFAGGLWLGGQDVNGQLKLAAMTYHNGDDYWPGPLNKTTAEINAESCQKWDKFFPMGVNMVKKFVAWYDCKNTPGCDLAADFPGYQIPRAIIEWPAHGDISIGQDFYLAPFYDRNGDGIYNPTNDGDYPYYDFKGEIDCRKVRDIRLFGDTTYWWINNDKGSSHTESNGPPIGMEIRCQAFAFATNDEVNNMTFYNYQLVNRSTFTLKETYFGQWVDSDVGNSYDDYVGCDVARGLGYGYNADNYDEPGSGKLGYGLQPPAIGVDFFEGPYQDNDSMDNPLTTNIVQAIADKGIPYKGLGLGYGDGVIDNERFGMRKFVYYNIGGGPQGDPQTALDYYNYLRGIWRDATPMVYGGNGHVASGATGGPCNYMFPAGSDPLNWGTFGIPQTPSYWDEVTANNQPNGRRFIQSAGPFTLLPGAINDITVGVVWARATSGGPLASVEKVRIADDKAQALFDNCFKVLNGPDAPDLEIQELDKELIIYLKNPKSSSNYNEEYIEKDPFIAVPDSLIGTPNEWDVNYRFEGYQIYQVKNKEVSVSELSDPDVSRLVAQCDVKNGVSKLVNFTYDQSIGANVPQVMVDGEDKGIRHSFKVTKDYFAVGDDRLINHKKYYYIAIAYGYNNYKTYDQLDPLALDGQKKPYLPSRKSATGSVRIYSGIPHIPQPEAGGTIQNADYGDEPQIKRMEGKGNSGIALDIIEEDEATILANGRMATPTYKAGAGPISVKVIDPLSVPAGTFTVKLVNDTGVNAGTTNLAQAYWTITEDATGKTISADKTIDVENEQLILDWGISVSINNFADPGIDTSFGNGFITATMTFADSSKKWLTGLSDGEGATYTNWILAGNAQLSNDGNTPIDESAFSDFLNIDPGQYYEKALSGTWGPFRLTRFGEAHAPGYNSISAQLSLLEYLPNVDIVITDDKSKWTRCPVLETQNETALAEGGAKRLELRKAQSVNTDGVPDGTGTGMGWFPGYAIDVDKGVRLNMAFGEDSWLGGENGRDMIWNPTSTVNTGPFDSEIRWGGKHYIYVFRETSPEESGFASAPCPAYDGGAWLYSQLQTASTTSLRNAYRNCAWVGIPLLEEQEELLNNDVRIRLRVDKAYRAYDTQVNQNNTIPWYTFNTDGIATTIGDEIAAEDALKLVNVVPNPYYAYSDYEESKFDNIVKVTNLPEECTVSIYNLGGTLIRRYQKSDPSTSLDWDLQNNKGVPVAGGVYLIHVNVEGVGEKTLKLFTVLRPTDVSNF